jgi:hypothetical protein
MILSKRVSIQLLEITFQNPSPLPFSKGGEVFPLLTKGDEGGLGGLFQRAKVLSKKKFQQDRKKRSPFYRLVLAETFSN